MTIDMETRTEVEITTEQQSEEENSSEPDVEVNSGAGWAGSIAKVLQTSKPKSKKSLVLSRAKKINLKSGEKKKYDFEIEGENKEEKPDKEQIDSKLKVPKLTETKNKKLLLRVKPSIKDREREKALKKIATRGVVQLFNAVRGQQKEIDKQLEEAGPLDHRKDAVLKSIDKKKFLNVLMGGERAKSQMVDNQVKDEIKSESSEDENESENKRKSEWSVLRNDFMTNKKLKHWDQDDSDDSTKDVKNSENESSDSN